MHLKGQNVNLLLQSGNTYAPVAASTSCDFNITANSTDSAAKDDPGEGMFDNPEFSNYSWTMSNESFIVSIPALCKMVNNVINGDASIAVQFQHKNSYGGEFCKRGKAIISSLTIDAANNDFAKLSISLDGNGELAAGEFVTITPAESVVPRIKGKALMVAVKDGEAWKTIACASSHKLTISCNVSDITDKDYNDKSVLKEVTGKSVSLSTENLIEAITSPSGVNGVGIASLYDYITTGTVLEMELGYYPDSIGQSIHDSAALKTDGWGKGTAIISGQFMCSSLSNSGSNKDDSTFSAEFQNKGKVNVNLVNEE